MKKLLKWLFILILPFVLFDIYKGICRYRTHSTKNDTMSLNTLSYTSKNHYWHFPLNSTIALKNEERAVVLVKTDTYGFRNNPILENPTLLFLGDSFTSAVNTQDKDTYAQVLINEGTTLYNAGMDGTGTCHQAYILKDILDHIHPQIIILNFYLGNDFYDNFFGPELQTLKNELDLKQNVQCSLSNEKKNSDSTSKFLAIEFLRHIKDFLLSYSESFKLIYQRVSPFFHEESDMLYYDRSEIKLLAYQEKSPDSDIKKALNNTIDALQVIQKIIESYNTKNNTHVELVVVGIPSKAQVIKSLREISNFEADRGAVAFSNSLLSKINFDTPDKLLADFCTQNNIPYFSLLPTFRKNAENEIYYHFDSHWNWRGQKIAAKAVFKWLKESGFISKSIQPSPFSGLKYI
ncbi:MAG: hypothetical protein B7Y25_00155 [Alphaproteobacteria bacterium 16-39-46]|nr:MAG: hypothetical protein B7Y25_00155 [Alphaproteobacteria bacterium 16-39-46]OZA44530.1 MAG: hypothetical protein B7X84_00165 [Alphaproteobacteria bacterium 17-39-52]HQS83377.1 hypothetical protein [Alphaproteobacteria bacterium]HQS93064.1 hypothetical protein [Alphaproteobacteria bacterium]